MSSRLAYRALALALFVCAAPLSSPLAAQHAHPVLRLDHVGGLERAAPVALHARLQAQRAIYMPVQNCQTVAGALRDATIATAVFALPVAAIAGKMSDDSWRAARWAGYSGAAYSYGVALWLRRRPRCTSTDPLAFIWTPVTAAAGAFIATR